MKTEGYLIGDRCIGRRYLRPV